MYKMFNLIQDSLARQPPLVVYFPRPPSCMEVMIIKFNSKACPYRLQVQFKYVQSVQKRIFIFRWLVLASHGIHKRDRQALMAKFRKVLYAGTLSVYERELEDFLNDSLVLQYDQFLSHIRRQYLPRKEKWCMHVRNDLKLPTNNNQTNNLCESSFRILKDIVFQRIRCFNLPDLTEMLLSPILYYK